MKDLIINKKNIAPGKQEIIKLNVARLPSGTVISIRIHVYHSRRPGPCVLVLGGVHGDEINGVEIVRRMVDDNLFDKLECGSVIAIPLLNVYGFIQFSRDAAEGKDVNRSFPGNMKGSLASRVAKTLTKQILPLIDFGVDYHTGGGSRYNYPQIRYSVGDQKAAELASQFASPFLISKPLVPKSLRKVSHTMDKPIVVYEGGESLRYDGFSIDNGLAGMKRLLNANGMLAEASNILRTPNHIGKNTWVRAAQSGMFMWSQQSGAKVSVGEPLGYINDPYGHEEIPVLANRNGYLIGHNNAPVVSAGDALFHIGEVKK